MSSPDIATSGSCVPIRSIAIVGRDADAWISALLLQLSLGASKNPIKITLVELPSRLAPGEVYPTLPSQQALHQLLGLDQKELLNSCGGLPSLGYRYSGWGGAGTEFFQPYDTAGAAMNGVAFIHYWARARQRGLAAALEEFSLCAASAKRGKYFSAEIDRENFSRGQAACNLPAIQYLKAIGRLALDSGVQHRAAELASVNLQQHQRSRENGCSIQSLHLNNGESITADLFIDASGDGELISHLEQRDTQNFESWAHWFPCDQALIASTQAMRPLPSFNQASTFDAGWAGLYPLAARTAVCAPFSSAHTNADQVLHTLSRALGTPQQPALKPLLRGRRTNPWQGNCVAVGAAATSLDPIQGTQLHLLHTSLSYLLTLIPTGTECMQLEQEIYSDRLAEHSQRLRDFQLAHYALNRRQEAFWQQCAQTPLPDSLQHKIELFRARGHIPLQENETFQEEGWQLLFAGCGLTPIAWHPRADLMAEEEQIVAFQNMLKLIATRAARMPDLESAMSPSSTTVQD